MNGRGIRVRSLVAYGFASIDRKLLRVRLRFVLVHLNAGYTVHYTTFRIIHLEYYKCSVSVHGS
jgi:hypothetical protein